MGLYKMHALAQTRLV